MGAHIVLIWDQQIHNDMGSKRKFPHLDLGVDGAQQLGALAAQMFYTRSGDAAHRTWLKLHALWHAIPHLDVGVGAGAQQLGGLWCVVLLCRPQQQDVGRVEARCPRRKEQLQEVWFA